MADPPNYTMELLLRQYDTLRKEIENCIHEQGQLATYGVIATGVVWSAVLGQAEIKAQLASHPGLKAILMVPGVLAFLFAYRIVKLDEQIDNCGEHLALLESEPFALNGSWARYGWDGKWDALRRRGAPHGGVRAWHRTYWSALVLINFVAAGVVSWVY